MVSSANVRAAALFPRVGSASAEGKAKERRAMDMKRILVILRFEKQKYLNLMTDVVRKVEKSG